MENMENMERSKGQLDLLQEPFLSTICRESIPVSIFLVNGVQLQGQIDSFDRSTILLRNSVCQLVYKHAISTILSSKSGFSITIDENKEESL